MIVTRGLTKRYGRLIDVRIIRGELTNDYFRNYFCQLNNLGRNPAQMTQRHVRHGQVAHRERGRVEHRVGGCGQIQGDRVVAQHA